MPATRPNPSSATRPAARGKFLWLGEEKLWVRGVTYGPLRDSPEGGDFRDRQTVTHDFTQMVVSGINSIRTYTVPPRWLLDLAAEHKIWVLVGLPWEQHVNFLDDEQLTGRILHSVQEGARACAGHPALLGFAIGNEIPAPIVRWHGAHRIERFIKKLYDLVKVEDPGALVTYVNYPSTEYLELPFVDLFCFNVYLEVPARFEAYLSRLQNLAGDKPLLFAETGLDSRRNGESKQAESLEWQIRLAFSGGSAGLFVFAWTDEWWRGGKEILDWDFGLTTRDRTPKPALAAVQKAFVEIPFPADTNWPRISVVVCTYRGVATLEQTLAGLQRLKYPDYEVIVVNDGSDEHVAAIADKFPVRLINIPHSGLSVARNVGCDAATGRIVAYIDDDAWPDPHWLQFLAHSFKTEDFAAVGGPNIPPETHDLVARCVAHAPGGPIHVLLTDREAEHIPGCNMAYRKTALQSIGGFDPQFRVAGDDVDLCWRFHEGGLKIGFNPGAMVWHHRRRSVRAYLKQQTGYGRAEALLEKKWPAKYNAAGQPAWHGRIYGLGRLSMTGLTRSRVYHGTWGSALFQSLYEPAPSSWWSVARMPEWYVVIFMLMVLMLLGNIWEPLLFVWPLLVCAAAIPITAAVLSTRRLPLGDFKSFALVTLLNLLQPLARLRGRVFAGLTPWGRRRLEGFAAPVPRDLKLWSEFWRSTTDWLLALEAPLEGSGATVHRGGDYDRWDLEVRGGVMGGIRLRLLVEEHGQGRQLVRIHAWPRWPVASIFIAATTLILAVAAAIDAKWLAAVILGTLSLICLVAMFAEAAAALATLRNAVDAMQRRADARAAGKPTPNTEIIRRPAPAP